MEKKEGLNKEKSQIILACIIYIFTVVSFASVTEAGLYRVFVGTIPVLVYLTIYFLFFHEKRIKSYILWGAPLLVSLFFFFLWNNTRGIATEFDTEEIIAFNVLLCYLMNIFLALVFSKETPRKITITKKPNNISAYNNTTIQNNIKTDININQHYEQKINQLKQMLAVTKNELMITKDNVELNLRSIEDKCKAINFVIGRVYSNKRGGNPKIRDLLKIDREYYNLFSELSQDYSPKDNPHLIIVLEKILNKLKTLDLTEKEVFRGNDERIIDVLKENDKDPVLEYHKESKEICKKLISYLKN